MVVETQNFLNLDFYFVAKILASSELNIQSEVEIFNAIISWLKHNSEERIQYAKQLLLKVRFSLLSDDALKHLLDCSLLPTNNNECSKTLKEVLLNQKTFNPSNSYKFYSSRYCSQNKFNILIFGGKNELNLVVKNVHQSNGQTMKHVKDVSLMTIERKDSEAVCLKGEVYVFGGVDNSDNFINFVEKYSPSTNNWSKVTDIFD